MDCEIVETTVQVPVKIAKVIDKSIEWENVRVYFATYQGAIWIEQDDIAKSIENAESIYHKKA